MSPDLYLAYVIACLFIALLPGPTITLIIATSIRHGTRAGLGNVAGTQVGLAVMIAVVGVGLASLIEGMGHWFEWLRLVGAAYLIWMGIQMFRSAGAADETGVPPPPRGGFFLQGVLVAASNPKIMVFFGAFFPQFIDPAGNYTLQIVVMGLTAMAIAAMTDGSYAILGGRAGRFLSTRRLKLISRLSGSFLVGGGLWLAFSRAK